MLSEYDFWKIRNEHTACVTVWSKLYRRELFDKVRFWKHRTHEDQELLLHIIPQCRSIAYSEHVILNYRMRDGSIVHTNFSLRSLAISKIMINEMQYYRERGWKDLALYAFGMGARNIEEGWCKLDRSNPKVNRRLRRLYLRYRIEAAVIIKDSDSFKVKLRMRLFRFSLPIYIRFRRLIKRQQ